MNSFQGNKRFTLRRCLGAGSMGVVYEARDNDRDTIVALKTLQKLEPREIYLFKQEFRGLTDIVHENLVPLYEMISDGEHWFFTMESITGGVDIVSYVRADADQQLTDGDPVPSANETVIRLPTAVEPADFDAANQQPRGALANPPELDRVAGPDDLTVVNEDYPGDRDSLRPQSISDNSQTGSKASSAVYIKSPAPALNYDRLQSCLLQIADGISVLHRAGKLHRDLKPANTLVRPDGQVVLLDFGLIAEMTQRVQPREDLEPVLPKSDQLSHDGTDAIIVGTVSYMSPEQAGAQLLLPASDWYAFGVILFKMLTDRLPFSGSPIEILEQKREHEAPAPSAFCTGIPEHLDALCVDLLKIDPSQRPGEAQIRSRLSGQQETGAASLDPVNRQQPFVGRHREIQELENAFNRVSSGEAVVFRLHGRSGAGKSALTQCFLSGSTVEQTATLISGRCYEQESVPYKAIDSVIDALTRFLIKLPDAEVEKLLPGNVASLARIFPVLNRVPTISELSRNATPMPDLLELRNRAFEAFKQLLFRIGQDSPVIMSIDDLQWGDVDSAALLAQLIQEPSAPRLLLLLAYRSEYRQSSDCLRELQSLVESNPDANLMELEVGPLPPAQSNELITTLIGGDRADLLPRLDWIRQEAEGSTYFLYELVRFLKAGLDASVLDTITLDDVIWQRVQRLAKKPLTLLEVISVSGQPIRLRNAQEATVIESLPPHIVTQLRSENLARTTGPSLEDQIEVFHDRIRECIVARLPVQTRTLWHRRLASSLEKSGDCDADTLAVHYDRAGDRTKASHYYMKAAGRAAEVLAFDRAEALYHKAVDAAEGAVAKAEVQEALIHFYTDMTRFEDAYALAREAMQPFGVQLPARFIPPLFLIDFIKSKLLLRRFKKADLLDLPANSDERQVWVVRLGTACAKAAYQIRPELCVALCTRLVNLCLKHGNTPDCAVSYMAYGAIFHGGVMGLHQSGSDYGRVSLDLVEKYECDKQRAEVNFVVGYFSTSWLKPATEAEKLWRIAYDSGMQTNDLFHTGCASAATIMSYFMRGVPMDQILTKSDEYLEFLQRAQLNEPIGCLQVFRQTIRNLRGQTNDHTSFSDDDFNENSYLEELASYGSRHLAHYYYVNKMQVMYLWKNYTEAQEVAQTSASYLRDSPGMLHSAEHHFYNALIEAALLRDPATRSQASARVLANTQKKFHKWASMNEHNFLHKERLIAAELSRSKGKTEIAIVQYDEAIKAADQFGYIQVAGLANELAAQLLLETGNKDRAAEYLLAAKKYYHQWGATAYSESL